MLIKHNLVPLECSRFWSDRSSDLREKHFGDFGDFHSDLLRFEPQHSVMQHVPSLLRCWNILSIYTNFPVTFSSFVKFRPISDTSGSNVSLSTASHPRLAYTLFYKKLRLGHSTERFLAFVISSTQSFLTVSQQYFT